MMETLPNYKPVEPQILTSSYTYFVERIPMILAMRKAESTTEYRVAV
jgi:hypothetical protein